MVPLQISRNTTLHIYKDLRDSTVDTGYRRKVGYRIIQDSSDIMNSFHLATQLDMRRVD